MKMTRRMVAGGLVGSLAAVAGLGRSKADTAVPINIGWLPGTYYAFYVARAQHLYEKHGLAPNYVKFTAGPPMFAAFQSGSIDVSWGGAVPAIIGAAQGVPLRVIALESVTKNALIVKNDSPIKSISDLAGKKIGSVKGSGAYFAMVKLLNKAGLDGKYQFVDMQMPSLLPAFEHGDVDGIWIWEPWATRAVASGGRKVADELDIFGAYPGAPIMARTGAVSEKPDAIIRFIAAMFEAQQSYHKDPTTAVQAMANELGISDAMANEIFKQDPKPTFQQEVTVGSRYAIVGSNAAQVKYFQDVGDFFFQNGFVKSRPDMKTAFATAPLADFMKSPTR
ncbi:MAG TPA: ABC transporter substrate-binding protein [Xanthobacteraceae bacterium]|nr:ABC transporter substrate-binding protein [Xanthobacteraceae bacterium]